jgi:hypothetical protein
MLKALAGIAAALLALAAAPAAAQQESRLHLVDLTDDFERIWTETQKLPEAQRAAYFKGAFAKILPGFYDEKRSETSAEKYDAHLLKKLDAYPAEREGVMRVKRGFSTLMRPALRSFEKSFGPMTGYPPIYLVNSLGEFDGGTRDLPEGTRLLFGADVIARLYNDRPIQPFFHHELFHLMHARTFSECDKLWCSLWAEGLATYVSAQLNPGANDDALLLTFPVPLRPAVEKNRAEAVCAVAARLDSEETKDYAPLFMGGGEPLSANLPRRFGYYVGYLVAQDLGRTRSLKQLAALSHAEARPLIEASLNGMANCSRGERG